MTQKEKEQWVEHLYRNRFGDAKSFAQSVFDTIEAVVIDKINDELKEKVKYGAKSENTGLPAPADSVGD